MAWKFSPFIGTLDYYQAVSGTSGVFGVPATTYNAIPRWDDTAATTIKNSKAIIQDGGAIEAQGFITNRVVSDLVTVATGQSWIASSIELEDTGSIEIEEDAELIIV